MYVEYVRKLESTKLPTQFYIMSEVFFFSQKIEESAFDVHLNLKTFEGLLLTVA